MFRSLFLMTNLLFTLCESLHMILRTILGLFYKDVNHLGGRFVGSLGIQISVGVVKTLRLLPQCDQERCSHLISDPGICCHSPVISWSIQIFLYSLEYEGLPWWEVGMIKIGMRVLVDYDIVSVDSFDLTQTSFSSLYSQEIFLHSF